MGVRLVISQPEDFGRLKAGQRRVAGDLAQPLAPTRRSISAHSAAVRWSFQRIAGRITRRSRSRNTAPCICPVRPIASTGPGPPVPARAGPRGSPATRPRAPARSSPGAASAADSRQWRRRRRRRLRPPDALDAAGADVQADAEPLAPRPSVTGYLPAPWPPRWHRPRPLLVGPRCSAALVPVSAESARG